MIRDSFQRKLVPRGHLQEAHPVKNGEIWTIAPSTAPSYPLFVLGTALLGACKGSLDVSINAQAVGVESAYGRPIMSSFQAAWSVGGLVGAALAGAALRSGARRRRKSRRSRRFHPGDCFLERSLSYSGKGCRADQFACLAGQSSPQRCCLHVSTTTNPKARPVP
jgi:hypothetical protein